MNCIASQFSKKMIAVSALTLFFLAFLCAAPAADKTVLVSFVSSHEQERAVNALIQSVRERGGACRSSRIYVLNSDPAEFSCRSLRQDNVQVLPLQKTQFGTHLEQSIPRILLPISMLTCKLQV